MQVGLDGDCVDNVAFGFSDSCTRAAAAFPTAEYQWVFWCSVATAATFIAYALPRTLYLITCRHPGISRTPALLLVAKVLAGIGLAGLRLGLLVEAVHISHASSTGASRLVASTALELAASLLIVALSPLEHFKRPRPSISICSYLFLTFIYDVTRCPSLWTASRYSDVHGYYATFRGLFTGTVSVELTLLVLESVRRSAWVAWDAEDHSPEETSSILSLGLYSWMNPLFWRGYREPLTMSHLYALDRSVSVGALRGQHVTDTNASDGPTATSIWQLCWWLVKPLGWCVLLPVFPRLCLLGFTFCQPFFIEQLLEFLHTTSRDSTTASGLITVAILIYFGISVSTAIYWYYHERCQSLLRAFLVSAIYRKTAVLQYDGDGENAAVTLMSADVERVYTGLRLFHEVWASMIEIALASWLLQRQIGLAFLAPLVVVLLGFAGSFTLAKRAPPLQKAWMERVQKRIGVTSSILGNIKDIRISGMTTPAAALVQRERESEIRVGERSRVLTATSASLSQLPQAIAPALAFAFGPHVMDETRAYTALSLVALLTSPLLTVLQSIPIISACVACLRRIKTFVDQDEQRTRTLSPPACHIQEKQDHGEDIDGFVSVRGGSFGWTTENAVLRTISLSLPRSSITFVVGPVAAGKSTLCRALLGEVPHVLQGSVHLGSDKVGYCDQRPFLFNSSILENIVSFSSFDRARYDTVIGATMLAEDLKQLPSGDKTVIGSKGVALSGGQRQRVALARALYHEAEILVLDDIFSGLDGSTQESVCQAVFGQDGLLRQRGTTTVLCTHSTNFLWAADRVIALSADGTLADQGTPVEISLDEERARRVGLSTRPDAASDSVGKANESKEETIQGPSTIATAKAQPQSQPQPGVLAAEAQTDEPAPTPTIDTAIYRHWLSTIGASPLIVYLVLVTGIGFCSNFPTIWLKFWSADSTSAAPTHSFAFWIGIYVLVSAGVVLFVFPAGLIQLRTGVRLAGTNLHQAAVHTIMHSSLRFLGRTDVGKVLNLFSQDTNIMDTQLPRMVNNLSICLAIAIGQAVVIAVSSAWLAISYPLFILLLWAVQRVYLPSSKRLRILDLEAKTPLYTNFLDTLAGLPTIRAFGWFPNLLARNNTLLDDSQRPSYLLAMAQQWLTLTVNILVALVAVILVGLVTQLGSSAGNVGAGLVSVITLGSTLTTIVIAYTGLETSLGAIGRLKSFSEDTEREDLVGEDVVPETSWPTAGRVEIKGVAASYGGTETVLKGLNLVVEAGEKVAICGRTGSGKSSVLALLLRLIDPLPTTSPEAPILIDGLPLHTVDRTTLRERILAASQDAVFLPEGTSVRHNLDPWGAAASDTECIAALRDVGLTIESMTTTRNFLDQPLVGLSAGQRQLFSLARAVLRRRGKVRATGVDGGLLLLDEITSSADAETEDRVREVLAREFRAWTVLMVTHRREMAFACGRVVVLDAGQVVEDGRPEDLWDRKGGRLRALWMGDSGTYM